MLTTGSPVIPSACAGNPANSLLSFLLESTEILPFVILKPLGLGIQPMLIVGVKGACSPDQPKISSFSALALGIQLMLKIAGIENVNQIIIQSAGSPKLRFEDDGRACSLDRPAKYIYPRSNLVCSPDQPKTSSFSALALGIQLMLKIEG